MRRSPWFLAWLKARKTTEAPDDSRGLCVLPLSERAYCSTPATGYAPIQSLLFPLTRAARFPHSIPLPTYEAPA